MSYSPALLKFLGIKLATEFLNVKEYPEQRLFQAILVQALEDAVNPSGFKKDTYYKYDSHVWFVDNSVQNFRTFVGELTWILIL
jgi:ACT domain-containing protein